MEFVLLAALIRHNQPGISAFRLGNGYAGLKDALGSDDTRLQRYAVYHIIKMYSHIYSFFFLWVPINIHYDQM